MKLLTEARLLRVFIGESDKFEGRPLYQVIVERARRRQNDEVRLSVVLADVAHEALMNQQGHGVNQRACDTGRWLIGGTGIPAREHIDRVGFVGDCA